MNNNKEENDKSLAMSGLMCDSSETNGRAEVMIDYILSWSLRYASDSCKNDNKPLLHKRCRKMLSILLGLDDKILKKTIFKSVKVWKEYQYIDVWVEVILDNDGKEENHAILIENKYYTMLHDTRCKDGKYRNQLEVYRERFDGYYQEKKMEWQRHYALITCVDRENPNFSSYKIAENFGFDIFCFYDLLGNQKSGDTESDIFNEFWLRDW